MAYLGREPIFGEVIVLDSIESQFNGSTRTFNLTRLFGTSSVPFYPVSTEQLLVSLGGVIQRPDRTGDTGFYININQITFAIAPPVGTKCFIVSFGNILDIGVPANNSVTSPKIVDGSVTPAKLSTGGPYWDTSNNLMLGVTSPVISGERITVYGIGGSNSSISIFGINDDPGTSSGIRQSRARTNSAAVQAEDVIGVNIWRGWDGTSYRNSSRISAWVDGIVTTNSVPGRLSFETTSPGATFQTEKMRLTSSGNLGINTLTPEAKLTVVSTTTLNGVTNCTFRSSDNLTSSFHIGHGAGGVSNLVSDSPLAFGYNNGGTYVERARFNASGYFKASNDGTYISSINPYHEFRSTANNVVLGISSTNTGGSVEGIEIQLANETSTSAYQLRHYLGATQVAALMADGRYLATSTSATTPAYSAVGDPNTGIFFPAADTLAFAEGGTEVMRITSDGKFLVGLTSDPSIRTYGQSVVINTNRQANGIGNLGLYGAFIGPIAHFATGNALVSNNTGLGTIEFIGHDGTDLNSVAALIAVDVDGTTGVNSMPGRIILSTTASGQETPTERLRINSSGNVGIGTPAPSSRLEVVGDTHVRDSTITGNGAIQNVSQTTVATTSATTISSIAVATARSARYQIQITQGTDYQTADILAIHNDTTVTFMEYGNISTGSSPLGTFSITISGGNMLLQVTMSSATSSTVKVNRTALGV